MTNDGYLVFKDTDGKETKEEVLRYIGCNDFLHKGAIGHTLLARTKEHIYYICEVPEYENDLYCTENPYEVGRTRILCYLINNHGKELRYVESFKHLMISNYILKKGIPWYYILEEDLKRGCFKMNERVKVYYKNGDSEDVKIVYACNDPKKNDEVIFKSHGYFYSFF